MFGQEFAGLPLVSLSFNLVKNNIIEPFSTSLPQSILTFNFPRKFLKNSNLKATIVLHKTYPKRLELLYEGFRFVLVVFFAPSNPFSLKGFSIFFFPLLPPALSCFSPSLVLFFGVQIFTHPSCFLSYTGLHVVFLICSWEKVKRKWVTLLLPSSFLCRQLLLFL